MCSKYTLVKIKQNLIKLNTKIFNIEHIQHIELIPYLTYRTWKEHEWKEHEHEQKLITSKTTLPFHDESITVQNSICIIVIYNSIAII